MHLEMWLRDIYLNQIPYIVFVSTHNLPEGLFEKIENEQSSNPQVTMQIDKKTVSGTELKNHLVSSGNFYVGDAVLIIEKMVENKKLKKSLI